MVMVPAVHDDDNDYVEHDVKNDPIEDSRRRLEHNIMSSITGSRHNCERGQPKPQLGGGAQPTTTTKPHGGVGRAPPQAPPHRGVAGIPWGGGGRRGVAALHHICPVTPQSPEPCIFKSYMVHLPH